MKNTRKHTSKNGTVIFDLTDEQDANLAWIAESLGVSKSEALRKLIEIYLELKEAK